MEKKNVPKIRFPGFTEPWEQRKLGDYLIQYTEVTTKNNQYPVLTSSRKGIFFQKDYYDGNQIASQDNTGYNIVPFGYFTYRHMSDDEIFRFNINNIVENGIVSTLYPVFTTNDKLDSKYLQYQLNYGREFKRYAILQKQGGSRTYMYFNKLKELILTLPPSVEEQEKISNFFEKLDNLISLHQRKLENLKKQKKGLLQKMFPEKGKKVPEIRFPEFTDDWEQRKLGDEAIEIIAGGDIDKNKILDNGKYPIYANALTNDGIVGFYNDFYRVKAPAVTVTGRGEVGHAKARMIDFTPVVRLLSVRSNHDSYFLENAINNHNVIVESTGVPQLTVPQLASYNICFPKKIEEEIKIGAFFNKLDNLITLHQRKLEHLQKQKKALLQQMFV